MEWITYEDNLEYVKDNLKYGEYYLLYVEDHRYQVGRFFDNNPNREDVFYTLPGFYCYMEEAEAYHLCSSKPMFFTEIDHPYLDFFNEYAEKHIWEISVDERFKPIFEPFTQVFKTVDDVAGHVFMYLRELDDSLCELFIDKNNEEDPTELTITYTRNGDIGLIVKAVRVK